MKEYDVFYCGEHVDTISANSEKEAVKKIMQEPFFMAKEVKKNGNK